MGENEVTNSNIKNSIFTVKKVLRVLTLLCIIFVFCPFFLVSCSGKNINVGVMTAVGGLSVLGEKVVDPHPVMLICLLGPILVLVILFLKKIANKKKAIMIAICSAINLIILFIFRASVKKIAEESYCSFKTTGWYILNIIVLLLIIVLSVLVVLSKMEMDTNLVTTLSGDGAQGALNQMSTTINQMSSVVTQLAGNVATNISNRSQKENTIGFCSKCGSSIAYGCKFCTSCGTKIPESILAEADAAKKAAEERERKEVEERTRLAKIEAERQASESNRITQASQRNAESSMFCQQCGAKLEADAVFCEFCGIKVE